MAIYSPQAFWKLANDLFKVKEERTFRALFGTSADVCSILWDYCAVHKRRPKRGMKPKHLLWALHFLKSYGTEDVLAQWADTTRKTWRKWVWIVLRIVRKYKNQVVSVFGVTSNNTTFLGHYCLPFIANMMLSFLAYSTQIKWGKRFSNGGDQYRYCMVSVDGTDFEIQEPYPFSPGWYSHKFKGPGLRYEVALAISTGDIVHINGPFPCGNYPDITIFRKKLKTMLRHGEMVEADNGYRGEYYHVRTPADYHTEEERREKAVVMARQETANRRFKQFGVLKQVFRHDINVHRVVFEAVVVITQLNINNGEKLFKVSYS